jgi:hypothetical protein
MLLERQLVASHEVEAQVYAQSNRDTSLCHFISQVVESLENI